MNNDRVYWADARRTAWMVGGAGLVACGLGAIFVPGTFLRSYLVAWCFWLNIALGSLAIIMVSHLTGGQWGLVLRRVLESGAQTLPLLLLLFLPVLLGLRQIYTWTAPEAAEDPVLIHKSLYLSVPGFVLRAIVFFALWSGMAWLLSTWSLRYDRSGDPRFAARMRTLSGPGLVIYMLTLTLASVDWIMSLHPHWFSTIFGVVFLAVQAMTAFAFAVVVLWPLSGTLPLAGVATPKVLRDLGNLLLMLVMFWAYVTFCQYLLIWSGNLPEEAEYYMPRFAGGWKWIALGLMLVQFALPFLLLLRHQTKRDLWHLSTLARLLLVCSFVNLFWQIIPAFPPEGLVGHWGDLAAALVAMLGIGGVWMGFFFRQLEQVPPLASAALRGVEVPSHG